MTPTLSPTMQAGTRTARVYAFPQARNVRTVERLLNRYLALWRANGYPEAAKIFDRRYFNALRRRLGLAGVPSREIEREVEALKVAMRALYIRNLATARAREGRTA